MLKLGFLGGSAGKESACNAGDLGLIPGLGRFPRDKKGYPFQYSGLENSMDYSPWGRKESDSTERLSLSLSCLSYTEKTNTEPSALVTNSDLFFELSKSSEITGLKKKKVLKWSPEKFKNHALDTFSFQNVHKTLFHSNSPGFFPHIAHHVAAGRLFCLKI